MSNTIPVTTTIDRLREKFGNHTRVSKELGYKSARSYRRARQRAILDGSLPKTVELLAERLLKDDEQEAAT